MDHFDLHTIHYYETTGSTPGIFISPEFWTKTYAEKKRGQA
jgi:hypothetical protein